MGVVPMGGIPPMGFSPAVPDPPVLGLGTTNFELSTAVYGAVFGALNVSPLEVPDALAPTLTCRSWGDKLVIRRTDAPTTRADVYLQAETPDKIQDVVDAVQAIADELRESGYFFTYQFGGDENVDAGTMRTWVQFDDPFGNVIWVTFTGPITP